MEIYRLKDRTIREKGNGNTVNYGLFPEYEININTLDSGASQDWHFHKKKEEVILVTEGELRVEWKDKQKITSETLQKGDLTRVENTPHRFSNSSSAPCTFICFKMVLSGESKREILAGDKFSYDPENDIMV